MMYKFKKIIMGRSQNMAEMLDLKVIFFTYLWNDYNERKYC